MQWLWKDVATDTEATQQLPLQDSAHLTGLSQVRSHTRPFRQHYVDRKLQHVMTTDIPQNQPPMHEIPKVTTLQTS